MSVKLVPPSPIVNQDVSTPDLSGFPLAISDDELFIMEGCLRSPSLFARNILGVQLWSKQEEVLKAIRDHRRVAVKAGNGLGKGFTAAVAVLWFLTCHSPAIVLTTAPTARQVRHVLWREIRGLHGNCASLLGGSMFNTRFEIADNRFALGLSTDEADQFQGFHSPNMLIVVDEAEGVTEPIYDAIEAVMTTGNCKLLLIGNPTSDSGTFRRAFHEDRRIFRNITISALESPNVEQQDVVIPGLTTGEWVAERRTMWGEGSPMYQARVLGQFCDHPQDNLIPLSKIEQAISLYAEGCDADPLAEEEEGASEPIVLAPTVLAPTVLAVDVARFGPDHSVLLLANSSRVLDIETHQGLDTMELTGRIVDAHRRWAPERIVVDEIGIGAGVVDRLKELDLPVWGINVGRPARQRRQFANLRAEGYWSLYELFNQGALAIPNDPELAGQLSSLRHRYNSKGQFLIEPKEETRTRGLPSPDKADALMLAFLRNTGGVRLWV